ncbi:MAG: SDR family oxidoreductase [Dehalococcoidia bacterium]
MPDLAGKSIVITGAASGIGAACAEHFAGSGRLCQPEDIAKACAFLLSSDADFILAHQLMVDSGYSVAGS